MFNNKNEQTYINKSIYIGSHHNYLRKVCGFYECVVSP